MKKTAIGSVVACGLFFAWMAMATGGEVKKIEVNPGKDSAQVVLHFDGQGKFRVFQSEKQASIVVEAENLSLPARLTRAVDAAAAEGPLVQVTPYTSGDARKSLSKFVIQLRGRVDLVTSELPGKFVLEMKRKSLISAQPQRGPRSPAARDELKSRDAANERGEEVARRLVEVLNAQPDEKNYFGSRVSFEGNQVSVHDVFRLVGEASGLNIITDSDVAYVSNYSLRDIPWDQLLDIVVQQAQLKAAVTGNVVRVITAAKFNEAQEARLREIDAADEMEPVVMAIVPLSFATAEEMKAMIEALLIKRDVSASGAAAGARPAPSGQTAATPGSIAAGPRPGGPGQTRLMQDFKRGEIQVDTRSNSLIVTNTRDAIERIRKLVQELDVPLPQVLIDAKIVIATESFSRNLGVAWGGRATSSGTGRAGIGAVFGGEGVSLGDLDSGGESSGGAPAFTISPGESGGAGIGFQIGAGRHGNLNAQLQLAEVNQLTKTVASPRIIVNNKKSASVTDGQTLLIPTPGGANTAGSITEVTAALNLTVTPQVTSAGSVLLDLNITKDAPLPSGGVENKSMQTEVLVDSGSTLVLGGVYQFDQTKGERGIPLLKDLPFIGQLFRTNSDANTKSELMVFITPQIIEASERGATF